MVLPPYLFFYLTLKFFILGKNYQFLTDIATLKKITQKYGKTFTVGVKYNHPKMCFNHKSLRRPCHSDNASSNANCMLHIHLQCGEIKDVRIAHNQLGRSKGFAYLEFTDQVSGTLTA